MTDESIDWYELGYNLFKAEPELLGAAVWRRATALSERQEDQFNFVSGYSTARRQHDDYEREECGAVHRQDP
jgi:hypothetical protein